MSKSLSRLGQAFFVQYLRRTPRLPSGLPKDLFFRFLFPQSPGLGNSDFRKRRFGKKSWFVSAIDNECALTLPEPVGTAGSVRDGHGTDE